MKNLFSLSGNTLYSSENSFNRFSFSKYVKAIIIFAFISIGFELQAQPVVSTFSPQSGPAGTVVTITGSGFSLAPGANVVFFGAEKAFVSASTNTTLTVNAPISANYDYISVTNVETGLTGYSTIPFNETFPGGCKPDFTAKVDFSSGTNPYSVSLCDMDKNGKPDLAVTNFGSNTVSVYYNISVPGDINSGSFAAKVDYVTGLSPKSVTFGDIDGDGRPDMIVANSGDTSVSVFRNTSSFGSINFEAKVDFTTGGSPWSVKIGDINGDGKPDIVVANRTGWTVSVIRNTSTSGSISFLPKVDFGTGQSPYSVSIGDLDSDGKPDLAVAIIANNKVSVFKNTSASGGVSFEARVDFNAGGSPGSINIGDIDGDGKLDLAVANNLSNNVSVFRNVTAPGIINSGSFAAKVDFAAGSNPVSVSIGDIDGDGIPDLAVANFTSNTVSVLRNTSVPGTVSFTAKVDFATGGQASSVSICDIDGDSKPEVTATNYNITTMSVLRNISTPPTLQTGLSGNGNPITNGSDITSLTNFTDFGNVTIGGNLIRTYTIENTSTDSLSVDSIKITGADSVLFISGSLTPPGKIASGGSKTFNVTFTPVSSGLKNATVRVYSNINSGTECLLQQTYTFAISGTGTSPVESEVLNFDGTNDNVALPNTLAQNLTAPSVSEITIEYWFKGSQLQSAVRFQNGSGYIVAGWGGTPGSQKHLISTEGGTTGINVGAAATDGNWHHVAITWKKNTVNGFKSFLDGALVDQRNSSNTALPNMNVTGYLGCYNGVSEFMNGSIDEVRIWKRELSQAEISANRFQQISTGTGLIASYHFNQGVAGGNNTGITTLTDATTNNYTGTLSNFTLNGPTSNFVGSGPPLIPILSTINITVIPEGFYNEGTDKLNSKDTVRAYLHSNVSPFTVIDSAVAVIDSVTLTGSFIFANAPSGTYYIRINHRNSIETWSKSGGEVVTAGSTMSYDFTSSSAQAFGSNMKQVDGLPTRYGIFSGDENQNGIVDLSDVVNVSNAASSFTVGYVPTDMNGDGVVDLTDLVITSNNASAFVTAVMP